MISPTDPDAPHEIEKVYTIDVPEGFVIEIDDSCEGWSTQWYINGDKYIHYNQYLLNKYTLAIDNETTKKEILHYYDVTYHIYDCENGKPYTVMWIYDGYVFEIVSNLDKEAVIDLCKSTKLK